MSFHFFPPTGLFLHEIFDPMQLASIFPCLALFLVPSFLDSVLLSFLPAFWLFHCLMFLINFSLHSFPLLSSYFHLQASCFLLPDPLFFLLIFVFPLLSSILWLCFSHFPAPAFYFVSHCIHLDLPSFSQAILFSPCLLFPFPLLTFTFIEDKFLPLFGYIYLFLASFFLISSFLSLLPFFILPLEFQISLFLHLIILSIQIRPMTSLLFRVQLALVPLFQIWVLVSL